MKNGSELELEQLILAQQRDMRSGHRTHILSLDYHLDMENGFNPEFRSPYRNEYRSNVVHGTIDAYVTFKCRCDVCRISRSEYIRDWKRKRLTAEDFAHGDNGYYIGCRCDICKSAKAETRAIANGKY